MIDAITGGNLREVKRIDALEATDVVPVLTGVGTAPVMCVNAANRAKIVLGRMRVELVNPEILDALDDVKPA
jgi:hypothetical protein